MEAFSADLSNALKAAAKTTEPYASVIAQTLTWENAKKGGGLGVKHDTKVLRRTFGGFGYTVLEDTCLRTIELVLETH